MSSMKLGLGLTPLVGDKQKNHESDLLDNSSFNNSMHDRESLIRITDSSPSSIVVGRCQLLTSFRIACNMHNCGEGDQEKSPYRDTFRWGVKAMSREMLRFSDFGMQIRGEHAIVRVNGDEFLPNPCSMNNNKEDEDKHSAQPFSDGTQKWSTKAVKLKPGDVLSIEPRVGHGLLEFMVVALNQRGQSKKESLMAKKSNNSIPVKGISCGLTNQCEDVVSGEYNHAQKNLSDRISPDFSRPTFLDDDSKVRNLDSTNNLRTGKMAKSPFLVHVFPYGNAFSASRRRKLEDNLESLGATILKDFWKAKYVVISESIRSLAILANRMHVQEEQLVEYFESNADVLCVLPSWAEHCITKVKCLVIPSRTHFWIASNSIKRNREELDENNGKQALYEDLRDRKKLKSNPGTTLQNRKNCFHRNIQVAEAFKRLANLHQSMPLMSSETWSSYSFRIAAGRIMELDFEIDNDVETQKRLRSINGFGKSICEKIQECIEIGTIKRIQEFETDPHRQAMKNMMDIWGVGVNKASDMINQGYRTIDDVRLGIRQNKLLLNRNQLVGVDCYEDILDEMPRSEVEAIGLIVSEAAESLFPGMETSIMGSYRRGKDYCGDVDIQLTHAEHNKEVPVEALGRIVDKLWNEGKIAMHLTSLHGMTAGMTITDYQKASQHVSKDAWNRIKNSQRQTEYKFYMGCFYSPSKPQVRRRVDIKFYPYRERAFAMLYFTGNGYFNRSMRLWTTRVFGWKLNENGVFERGDGKTRVFEASTEREIFDRLRLVYREPHERHYWDALEPLHETEKTDLTLNQPQLKDDLRNNVWVN